MIMSTELLSRLFPVRAMVANEKTAPLPLCRNARLIYGRSSLRWLLLLSISATTVTVNRVLYNTQAFIAADDALGCGFAPPDFYRGLEEEAWELEEELARLRGYRDANAMMMDTRGLA